jgi:Domain of unknown function (DUF1844)
MTDEVKADSDWKEQAQAEKQKLSEELDGGGGEGDADDAAKGERPPLPPASFPSLMAQFGMQAAMYLGDLPNPMSGKASVDLEAARYHIDMLGVLQEKTKGNLTPEEESEMQQILTGLRMRFVEASSNPAPESMEEKSDSKIVMP